eukprot:2605750-Alexandrium_andersonii.AAC.1
MREVGRQQGSPGGICRGGPCFCALLRRKLSRGTMRAQASYSRPNRAPSATAASSPTASSPTRNPPKTQMLCKTRRGRGRG